MQLGWDFSNNFQLFNLTLSDEVMNTEEAANLDSQQKSKIQELFSQGVKHKMRMNFVRQLSKAFRVQVRQFLYASPIKQR